MNVVRAVLGWVMPLVILGGGIALFLLLGSQPPPARKDAATVSAVPVRTAEVELVSGGLSIEADGVVVPLREVTLAAEVPGRVKLKTPACNEGQFVKKGTLLFEIDPRDYELDVDRLERELKQSALAIEEIDAELAQNAEAAGLARRQVELAGRESKRLEGLKAGKIVTESEHDRALRDELTAANALTALDGQKRVLAKRRIRLEEAESLSATLLSKAKLDLARTRIVAPADGIVVEDKVEQDSFVAKGTPLVTIEDTAAAEVRTSLEMDDVSRIWRSRPEGDGGGESAHAELDTPVTVVYAIGDAEYEWDGTLSRQEGRGLDEKTRTLPCRVLVQEPRGVKAIDRYGARMPQLPPGAPRSLLRGMFVQVRVHVDSPGELVSIPEDAQRPSGDVWVMRDGKLLVVRPQPVQSSGGRIVFESAASGLLPGDRVVTSQLSNPRAGMAIVEPGASETKSAATTEGKDAT
jgi:multidrug efflux pump subunit AcrA (membrane-fusion protein)